jgi:hypothetical protein
MPKLYAGADAEAPRFPVKQNHVWRKDRTAFQHGARGQKMRGKMQGAREAMSDAKKIKGVIGVFTNPNGEVIASAPVFDRTQPGGFTLLEAQRCGAKRLLAYEIAKAYCSSVYVDSMSEWFMESAMNAMLNKGFKAKYIVVGHEEEQE